MARRATIQLNVHRQIVQSIPLDDADIDCLLQGLWLVTPCTQRIDRLIDLLEQRLRPKPRAMSGQCNQLHWRVRRYPPDLTKCRRPGRWA
jgi:hypothetical protein